MSAPIRHDVAYGHDGGSVRGEATREGIETPVIADNAGAKGMGRTVKRAANGIRLEPQPTDDPRDPLNWSLSRKILTLGIVSFAALVGLAQALCNQAGIVVQGEVYGVSPTTMANSVSAAIAGLATGPFLWSALALKFGRSAVIFWALLVNLGINVWSACMTHRDEYNAFVVSRWLGGTFGSAPSTIGAGIILDVFYLHQRGRAFACYTIATLIGTQFGGTFSGYITATTTWTAQLWWTVGALGLACILVFLFLEDTTYDRTSPPHKRVDRTYLQGRIATFFPGTNIVEHDGEKHGYLDPFIIGVQPVTILAGSFLLITFAWSVAVTTLLSVFLQEPRSDGGYGVSPLANANLTFAAWIGIALAETYNLVCGDRLPLWRCRRNGGLWEPEYRLYPLLVPNLIFLPVALGIFGSALQYHLHYMVVAFAVALQNVVEISLVPVVFNYVCEGFTSYSQEVATALNFYRLILGLTVTFYIDPWVAAVGPGWTFGMMACLAILGFSFTVLLAWKGPAIRRLSLRRFRVSEAGEALFADPPFSHA